MTKPAHAIETHLWTALTPPRAETPHIAHDAHGVPPRDKAWAPHATRRVRGWFDRQHRPQPWQKIIFQMPRSRALSLHGHLQGLLRVGYLPLRCSIASVFCVVCSTRPCLLDGKAGGLPSSLSTSPIHVRCVRRQGCDSLLVPLGGGKRCLNANVNCAQGPCDHACTVIKGCSVRSRVASFAAQRRDARSWHARTDLCCGDDTVLAFRWA